MPLVHFFETSFGRTYDRDMVLVEAVCDGVSGWGECTAGENPFYNEEWTESQWLVLRHFIAPQVLKHKFDAPGDVAARTDHIRGHKMARGGLEVACWDLAARLNQRPLYQEIGGGAIKEIACGVSIGIQNSIPELLKKIETEVNAGYQRIKVKIKPGWDIPVMKAIRKEFPAIRLMGDANSAYTLKDIDLLKQLDEFNLIMVEQPLAWDDIIDHVELQAQMKTPICLDECIKDPHKAEQAVKLKACGIINIKLGRVGGFRDAKRVHDIAQAAGIPVWCGGMLESGIGRAHNIAMSTLPNFVLPGDVSASKRYWKKDIIVPEVEVSPRGTLTVREDPGFGFPLDHAFLKQVTVREEVLS